MTLEILNNSQLKAKRNKMLLGKFLLSAIFETQMVPLRIYNIEHSV